MVGQKYARAYTEVLEIISLLPEEEVQKIPSERINFYQENRDTEYNYKIDKTQDISEQEISNEANAIMVSIFMDYFLNAEERERVSKVLLQNQAKRESLKDSSEENIFKSVIIERKEEQSGNTELVQYKENIFTKIKNFFMKLFHKD